MLSLTPPAPKYEPLYRLGLKRRFKRQTGRPLSPVSRRAPARHFGSWRRFRAASSGLPRCPVVGIFPKTNSMRRPTGTVLLDAADEWQFQHRYMQVDGMAGLTSTLFDETLTSTPPKTA